MARQAILLIHRRRFPEAEKKIEEAKSSLRDMEGYFSEWRELGGSGAVYTAYQEFTEAKILFDYVQSHRIPDPESIGVPGVPYLLGLADLIGELRRLTLDLIRAGDFEASERSLATMEEIHALLMTIDTAPAITPGLRRKGDSMRRVIEITRGDVTTESRRRSLERSLVELQRFLGDKWDEERKKEAKTTSLG